ncbi:MAG: cupin domain-containing protein [Candidatus Sungbacteria bacterium]|nr:cupin domain-containing protein [bacterium]MDZ4260456.1 cupin domain-containing protein [Candidatus Sungbacteria bacterium]
MKLFRQIKPEFIDVRGGITRLLDSDTPIVSILTITSNKGSVRSNHYHKKDTHYCYLVSGKMEWFEKPVEGGQMESAILEPGDMVFTPAMTIHAVRFLEDSVFLTFATEARNQADYEADTVRVTLIEEQA